MSEEDIPTLGKLKKINKRDRRRNNNNSSSSISNLDLLSSSVSITAQEGGGGGGAPGLIQSASTNHLHQQYQEAHRKSVLGLPGLNGVLYDNKMDCKPLYQSCTDLSYGQGKKKKKTRRKLSFAGFLPFLFSDKLHLGRLNARHRKHRESSPLRHDDELVGNKASPSSLSSASSTDSDGSSERRSSETIPPSRLNYRDKSDCRDRLANKRHSVTFGCLRELAMDMQRVESLKSILEKADWLSSQEKLANQISEESNNDEIASKDENEVK